MARRKKFHERTKSAKIVRALAVVTGRGWAVFNDAIVGGRSIKVKGWDRDVYETAIAALDRQGIKARLVITPVRSRWCDGGQMRIHTQEA